jgi:hypothetical protein
MPGEPGAWRLKSSSLPAGTSTQTINSPVPFFFVIELTLAALPDLRVTVGQLLG